MSEPKPVTRNQLICVSLDGGYGDSVCDSHIRADLDDFEPPRCTGVAVAQIDAGSSVRKICRPCIDVVLPSLNLGLVVVEWFEMEGE